jgi:hypothetical protein
LRLERGGRVQLRPFFIEQRDRDNFNKPQRLVDPPLSSKAPSEFLGNDHLNRVWQDDDMFRCIVTSLRTSIAIFRTWPGKSAPIRI